MKNYDCEIVVVGGGLSGLIATAAFAKLGMNVICCNAHNQIGNLEENRVTAFLGPSIQLIKDLVKWEDIQSKSKPLTVMTIADVPRNPSEITNTYNFNADMIGEECFGFAVENKILAESLKDKILALSQAQILNNAKSVKVTSRLNEAIVQLESGERIRSLLVVAADGRNSQLRTSVNIDVIRFGLGQKAFSFNLNHEIPHNNETIELYSSGGPFTFVPIENLNGKPASAIVWMETRQASNRLFEMSDDEFQVAANERSLGLRGACTLVGPRRTWPVYGQLAKRMGEGRLVLIGEAAHVVPPIGAQGLNLTMADIGTLLNLINDNKGELGSPKMINNYNKMRQLNVRVRSAGVMLLNWVSSSDNKIPRKLRRWGLASLARTPTIRNPIMRLGMKAGKTNLNVPWA